MEVKTYSERIRHPSGALNPPREKKRTPNRILWLLFISAVAIFVGWKCGWFKGAVASVRPISNSRGWV